LAPGRLVFSKRSSPRRVSSGCSCDTRLADAAKLLVERSKRFAGLAVIGANLRWTKSMAFGVRHHAMPWPNCAITFMRPLAHRGAPLPYVNISPTDTFSLSRRDDRMNLERRDIP
jgi:hypothetical protein